ncbi:MAG: hypothetical protein WAS55_01150 [Saprospiraceae bacterium]|nr:hypothetical protein [Saprospiraceae bacterium]
MKNQFEHLDLFDKYMYQSMSEEENLEFEESLNKDSGLRKEFDLYKVLTLGIQRHEEQKMRDRIRKIVKARANSLNTYKNLFIMKKYSFTQIASAAMIFLFLTTGIYYFFLREDKLDALLVDSNNIAKREIRAYINELTAPGMVMKDKEKIDSIKIAIDLFERAEYSSAKVAFKQFVALYPTDQLVPLATFHLARIAMGEEDYSNAIRNYEAVAYLDDFEFQDLAQFYMAQCLWLYNGKSAKDLAKKLLIKVIENPNSNIAKHAQAYLDMIQ